MRNLTVLAGIFFAVAAQGLAVDGAAEKTAIVKLIEEYYVGAANNLIDVEKVKKGFHEKFTWQLVHGGRMFVWGMKQWRVMLERDKWLRPEWKNRTTAQIEVVGLAGDAAVARVEIYNNKIHDATDFLSLCKFKDGWKVTNKISHHHEAPPEVRQQRRLEWEASINAKMQPPDRVMDAIGLKPGMTVGEIGAGHGRYTVHLARRVGKGGKVFANDIDKEALKVLSDRLGYEKITNVETVLGEEVDPKFRKNSLDMAFMVWVFHHLDKPTPLMKNLIPALRPGATLVIVDPVDSELDQEKELMGEVVEPDRPTIRKRVEKAAEDAGFELVGVEDFLPRDYIFILKVKEN
jgi:SAM-dependent methyltransferase